MEAIVINNLYKKFKDTVAVNHLDLIINEGELFALLCVNGAGKTTTIKTLTGLTALTEGDAFIFGKSIKTQMDSIKPLLDISMQETAVARKLTVEENIVFYAELKGKDKNEIAQIKEFLYDKLELRKVANKRADQLSGGYQRKLSIALSLVGNPKILFLDEPTLGLDVIARRELWNVINKLKKQMTIILTTHYMEEAEALADRIGIMKDGKLLFVGTKYELFETTKKQNIEEAFISVVSGGGLNV